MDCRTVGIIGGMGPYADIDIVQKIRMRSHALKDQEHIPIVLVSYPSRIPDRSEYIMGKVEKNPGEEIFEVAKSAIQAGAEILAITCATAHSPRILNRFLELADREGLKFEFVHLIGSVAEYIAENYPSRRAGILSTYGSYVGGSYDVFDEYGIARVFPDEDVVRDAVHSAIYHEKYGIKASPVNISEYAINNLKKAMDNLVEKGAQLIVLGCTELPLAIKTKEFKGVPVVDINDVLAMKILERCKRKY